MPRRIHTSSCCPELVELAMRRSARPRARLALAALPTRCSCRGNERSRPRSSSTMRVVTRSRNARSCVMTIDRRAFASSSSSSVMPSMSRWLVGSSSSIRSGRSANASASARACARRRSSPADRPLHRARADACIRSAALRCASARDRRALCVVPHVHPARRVMRGSRAASAPAATRAPVRPSRCDNPSFLLISPSSSSIVSRNRIQQRALAGAVAPDQPDTIAGVHRQRCTVEQRMQAEREFGIENRQQRHRDPSMRGGVPR